MVSKKVKVFKVVRKIGSVYASLHERSFYYALKKDTYDFRTGLVRGIWCYRSVSRAKKAVPHLIERYKLSEEEVAILEGHASWKNSQRRPGGILIVEEVKFLREI